MVHYFYRFDYLEKESNGPKRRSLSPYGGSADPNIRFGLHAKIYALAEKYGIPGLKELALEKFSAAADYISSRDYDEFALATSVIYSSTIEGDKGLRDVVVKTILANKSLLKHPAMEVTLTQINGLCYELLVKKSNYY